MRKFFILLFTCFAIVSVLAIEMKKENSREADKIVQNPSNLTLYKSILKAYNSMPADSNRIVFLRESYEKIRRNDWCVNVFLMGARDAEKLKCHSLEILMYSRITTYYLYAGDIQNIIKSMKILRAKSYQYNLFDEYISRQFYVIDQLCAQRNIDLALHWYRYWHREAEINHNKRAIGNSYLCLGTIKKYSTKYKETILAYKKALQYYAYLTPVDKENCLLELGHTYYSINDYKNAEIVLLKEKAILDSITKDKPAVFACYKERMLSNETYLSAIYYIQKDARKMKAHLLKAQKYYTDNCFVSYFAKYHQRWGEYYALVHQWDKALKEMNTAEKDNTAGNIHWYMLQIIEEKATFYEEAGRIKEALATSKMVAWKGDSLLVVSEKKRHEILMNNTKIKDEWIKKESYKKLSSVFFLLTVIVFGVFVLAGTARLYYSYYLLRKSKHHTKNALDLAAKTDRMKKTFLKNMVHDIQIPIDNIVEMSKLLAHTDIVLSPETKRKYTKKIKDDSDHLMKLIMGVLELSRLEAGMTRFDIQKVNVIHLINDAIFKSKRQENSNAIVHFQTMLTSLEVDIDNSRLLNVLSSLFTDTRKEDMHEIYCLIKEEMNEIKVEVIGSPLSSRNINRMQELQNDINRNFIESFQGTYAIDNDKLTIIIALPARR